MLSLFTLYVLIIDEDVTILEKIQNVDNKEKKTSLLKLKNVTK